MMMQLGGYDAFWTENIDDFVAVCEIRWPGPVYSLFSTGMCPKGRPYFIAYKYELNSIHLKYGQGCTKETSRQPAWSIEQEQSIAVSVPAAEMYAWVSPPPWLRTQVLTASHDYKITYTDEPAKDCIKTPKWRVRHNLKLSYVEKKKL